MTLELNNILIRLSQFSTCIPLVFGFMYVKRLNAPFRVLLIFIVFSLLMEYFATWYALNISGNNLPPLHAYTVIETGCLSFIFCRMLYPAGSYLFWSVLAGGLFIAVLNAFVLGSLYQMNHLSRSFESILLVIFSLAFFKKGLTAEALKEPIFKLPMFWFSTAVLLYFSVNLLFFLLFNEVYNQSRELAIFGQVLHSITNILTNLLFAQSFRCFRKEA